MSTEKIQELLNKVQMLDADSSTDQLKKWEDTYPNKQDTLVVGDNLVAGDGIDITKDDKKVITITNSSTTDLSDLKDEVKNLTDTVDTKANQTDLDDLSGKVDTNTSNIESLTSTVDTKADQTDLDSLSTKQQADYDALNALVSDLTGVESTDFTNVSNLISETKAQVDTNTSSIESLTSTVGTNTSDISSLQTQVETNTNDISSLQDSKQDNLTAGAGIEITDNTISCTLDPIYEVVVSLPTTGIPNKIYIVPQGTTGDDTNVCIEYIWIEIDDEGRWEKFGEFKPDVDLSTYVTQEELEDALKPYITSDTANATFVTNSTYSVDMNNLQNEINSIQSGVEGDLTNYLTKDEASETYQPIGDYVTNTSLNETLVSYVTGSDLTEGLNKKQDTLTAGENITINDNVISAKGGVSSVSASGDDVLTLNASTNSDGSEITITGSVDTYGKDYIDSKVDELESQITTAAEGGITNISTTGDDVLTLETSQSGTEVSITGSVDLSDYTTNSELSTTLENYVTSNDMSTTLGDYVTNSELTTTLGDYVSNSDLTTTLGDYVTSSSLDSTLSDYATKDDLDSKQDTLTAGTGIDITDNTIACTLDTDVFKIVEELPTSDIDSNVIYVVPSGTVGDQNQYTEYIYVNGEWEKLGEFAASVDLSDYYTKEETYSREEVDQMITQATQGGITTVIASGSDELTLESSVSGTTATITGSVDLSDYAKTSDLDDYAKTSDLTNYVTSDSLNNTLGDYVSNSELTTTLGDYVTNNSLSTTLGDYVSNSELTTTLGDYAKTSDLSDYATKDDLDSKQDTLTAGDNITISGNTISASSITVSASGTSPLTLSATQTGNSVSITGTVDTYTTSQIDDKIVEALTEGTVDLSGYLTKTEASETYQPIGDYVTSSTLDDYAKLSDIPSKTSELTNDSGYITSSDIPTLGDLGGVDTINASGTSPLTLSASKSGTSVTITGSVDLGDYVTSSSLSTTLGDYVTSSSLDSTLSDYATKDDLDSKQDTLTAGTGISITNNTIACTLDTDVFIVVTSLPTTGIENKIYCVPSDTTGDQNIYTEYLYINGAWEKIGEFKADVDLSSYATTTYVDEQINSVKTDVEGDFDNLKARIDANEENIGLIVEILSTIIGE